MADFPNYFDAVPSAQNALDLFKGEWSCRLPDETGLVASTGPVRAFEDYRIEWFSRAIGGFAGKRVLELGPLEAAHTYMVERAGATEVVSIEANSRAYLKCLVIKEVFGLHRAKFELGDFVPYLSNTKASFDIAIASGVLYHQKNPVELLSLLAQHCDTLLIWTHFFDRAAIEAKPEVARYFDPEPAVATVAGYRHSLYRKRYGEALEWKGFCGGGAIDSCWLPKSDIVGAVEHFGFRVVDLLEETNANGPAMLLAAQRK